MHNFVNVKIENQFFINGSRHRVVQQWLKDILGPICNPYFSLQAIPTAPNLGCRDAIAQDNQ